jgi:hypothetical protein
LASRGTADQLFIQARSFDCLKRATCFGFFIHLSSDKDNNRSENKHVMYKTLIDERGILFSFLQMFM